MAKTNDVNLKTVELRIDRMDCQSCEKIIEREVKSIAGVAEIKVDYGTGKGKITYDASKANISEILDRIHKKGYIGELASDGTTIGDKKGLKYTALMLGSIVMLIGVYFLLGGMNLPVPELDKNASLLLIFTIGLLTGFHCIAMCGGFVVSYTSKSAIHQRGLSPHPHILYGLGKTASYTIIGGVFGLIGSVITFTPLMRGIAAVLAGVFLIIFGLNMLDMFRWFRRFRLKTPQFIEKIVSKREGSSPLVTGLLNGLMIACGPLQAMYILAAASGSMYYGALYLFVYGVGTLPVLLGFGMLTSFVSSQLTHKLLRFSGVVVIVLGVVMLNHGLVLAGTNYDLKTVLNPVLNTIATPVENVSSNVASLNSQGFQEIHMNVTRYGWTPDKFVLNKGVPVKWVIDGQEINNCNKAIQVPALGLKFDIKRGLQTIEFTPKKVGTIRWSCWMGMIEGVFVVKDNVTSNDQKELNNAIFQPAGSGEGCSGGCGGGCGAARGGGSCGCGGGRSL